MSLNGSNDRSNRIDARHLALLVILSLAIKAFFLVVTYWIEKIPLSDITLYDTYASWIMDGRIPYKDFMIEYPQLSVIVFVIPRVLSNDLGGSYYAWFYLLMTAFNCVNIWLIWDILGRIGKSGRWRFALTGIYALSPLVNFIGVFRYDVFPTMVVLLAIKLLVHRKAGWACITLALSTMIKWFPVILLPPFSSPGVTDGKSKQGLGFFSRISIFFGAVLTMVSLFLLAFGDGFVDSYTFHFERVPNTGSIQFVLTYYLHMGPHALEIPFLIAMVLCLLFLCIYSYKNPNKTFISMALLLLAFLLFDKVWSIQFGIWLTAIAVLAMRTRAQIAFFCAYSIAGFIEHSLMPTIFPIVALKWGMAFAFFGVMIYQEGVMSKTLADIRDVLARRQRISFQHLE